MSRFVALWRRLVGKEICTLPACSPKIVSWKPSAGQDGFGRDGFITPAVTVWVFLAQCLSPDHSCRDAVAQLIAWRLARD